MTRQVAWLGDPQLKSDTVLAMKQSVAADQLIQGFYQATEIETGAKIGCFLGCLLPTQRIHSGPGPNTVEGNWKYTTITPNVGWHRAASALYGLPPEFLHTIEYFHEENRDRESAGQFAIDVLEAIPVGAPGQHLNNIADVAYDYAHDRCPHVVGRCGCAADLDERRTVARAMLIEDLRALNVE